MTARVEQLGLERGEMIRFRRPDKTRWQEGRVASLERDGSLLVHDRNGAARSIPLHLVEVRSVGPRGAHRWEPLLDRAKRTEQLDLF